MGIRLYKSSIIVLIISFVCFMGLVFSASGNPDGNKIFTTAVYAATDYVSPTSDTQKKKPICFNKKIYRVPHKSKVGFKVKNTTKAGKKKLKYWTSDPSIAIIKNGTIRGKKRGKCILYAKAGKKRCKATIYVTANPELNATNVPILTFHRIITDQEKQELFKNNQWMASKTDFEKQMRYLKTHGYITVDLDSFYQWYYNDSFLPENAVVLTFDDGYYETYYHIYPIIKKHGFKATVFIIGSITPDITPQFTGSTNYNRIGWDMIRKTKLEYPNFDYQSHSWNMHYKIDNVPRLLTMTPDEIKEDIQKMNQFGFRYFAYPYGGTNQIAKSELANSQIKMAFGFKRMKYARKSNPPYEINRIKVNGQITLKQFAKIVNRY